MKKTLFLLTAALILGNSNSYADNEIENVSLQEKVETAESSLNSKQGEVEKRIDEKIAQAKATGQSTENLERKKKELSDRIGNKKKDLQNRKGQMQKKMRQSEKSHGNKQNFRAKIATHNKKAGSQRTN